MSYLPLAQDLSSIPAEPMSFACRAEADLEDAPGFAPTRFRYQTGASPVMHASRIPAHSVITKNSQFKVKSIEGPASRLYPKPFCLLISFLGLTPEPPTGSSSDSAARWGSMGFLHRGGCAVHSTNRPPAAQRLTHSQPSSRPQTEHTFEFHTLLIRVRGSPASKLGDAHCW